MHRTTLGRGFHITAGPLADGVTRDSALAARMVDRLWRRDPSLWSQDAAVQKTIANRLGWLDSPALMASSLDRLTTAAGKVRDAGFQDVVLLGMGGSSLAPEVLRGVIGITDGWPRLHMLDSTDPAAVLATATDPQRTIYILASKSGTTIEPNSLAAHFIRGLEQAGVSRWADHFIAITDEGTELAARARSQHFREVFINPTDIGGRYSALSFFGLVPAALMGQPVAAIVEWSTSMLAAAQATVTGEGEGAESPTDNPAVALGVLMAAGARAGRDKLTLVVPPALEPFGLWVEQLVAESTGKQGVGVVPIAGETFGEPRVYSDDRVFVRLRHRSEGGPNELNPNELNRDQEVRRDRGMNALGNVPVATFDFTEPSALGAEFVRWEIATAVAGALLGINPFDEPNVKQAKDATNVLLQGYQSNGHLPAGAVDSTLAGGARLTLTSAARTALGDRPATDVLTLVTRGDYLGLLAYLGPDPALSDVLHRVRMSVRDAKHVATMLGYGPRYLHSTGQLHKGGPNTGVFVLVTAQPATDVEIPGAPYSFGTLELAQALGDFASLEATGRRAIHVHLPSASSGLLRDSLEPLLDALR